MRILGLDVGEKRIGVAKADSNTRIAVPVGYINVDGSEWQRIARIANLQGANCFVVGLPRSNEGNETKQSEYARNFAAELARRIPGARIRFQDESLTSVLAEERLKSRKRNYEKGEIDAEAATVILQDFMESVVGGFEATQPENGDETAAEINTKAEQNGKKKSKKGLKIFSALAIFAILGAIGTGVALMIREKKHEEYLAWVAEQEALMQAEVFNFTIRPGETIYDVKKSLAEAGYKEADIEEAMAPTSYNHDFLSGVRSLEGYLYGETHEFYVGTSAKEIIDKFLQGTQAVIEENNLAARYSAQGLTLHEGITLASVVQKEAAAPDMPTVAQVFLTRLSYGIPLGSDVTVSYALDALDPDREAYSDNQAALGVDSCYNTRKYAGLPCGPISNPGLAALEAVAEPSDTSYLYFLTGDDGLMYYSYTEAEHLQNAALYCSELCQVSL